MTCPAPIVQIQEPQTQEQPQEPQRPQEEEEEQEVVSASKPGKKTKRNGYYDNFNDLDDVSSFSLGGNDGKEFGDVSTRLITNFVICYVTCFNLEIFYAIYLLTCFCTFFLMPCILSK